MLSIIFCLLILFTGLCVGELEAVPRSVPRNPPPVFETDYTLPATETPRPLCPTSTENFAAVALYSFFLLVAGLAAYRHRSRRTLFLLAIGSVTLLGFVLHGCPCPVGMFQNVVDAFLNPTPFIPWTVIILFTLPLLVALFFGRIFCSGVCPLGAVQELTALVHLKIPEGVEQGLGLLRYLWLGLGVFFVVTGLGYLVCRFDPYVGLFRFGGLYPVLIFSGLLILLGFFVGRPFCRFLCPYGALLGLCGKLTSHKISVTPGECTKCRLCEDICPYNAILRPTVEPTPQERRRGPRRLVAALLLFPLLVLLFAWLGSQLAPRLAPWHFDVRAAELLYAEEQNWVDAYGTFPETRAVLQTGRQYTEVYRKAADRIQLFRSAGLWLGVWIGAVLGLKLISLTRRRRRTDYEVDPARCVACGRCFWYCPNQEQRRILLEIESTPPALLDA